MHLAVAWRTEVTIAALAVGLVGGGVLLATGAAPPGQPEGTNTPTTAGTSQVETPPPTLTATPTPTGPVLLPPNLQALAAGDVSVTTEEGVRKLRFAATLVNVGVGPVELRPDAGADCPPGQRGALQWTYADANGNGVFEPGVDTGGEPSPTGCMLFHPTHDHWHFDASARYVLSRQGSTDPVVMSDKVSFCIRDSDPLPGATAAPKTYGECTRDSIQGISTGWIDVYEARLDGQALPLPPELADGSYCLHITVDPHSLIRESHEGDNLSVSGVTIQGRQAFSGPPEGCA